VSRTIKGNAPSAAVPNGFKSVAISAADGLRLHARDYSGPTGSGHLPIVCLPGLTRNARDFHQFATLFSNGLMAPAIEPRRVICLDYRGRGGSDRDKNADNYSLTVETNDVQAALAALDVPRAIFFGTSRGALIIHLLAATRPTMIASAILNDAGPVIEGAGLAQIRGYLTRLPQPKDWDQAVDILKQAHGKAFPALEARDWREMAEAIYVERKGKIVSDFDQAIVKQLNAIDFNTQLPTLWPQFDALAHVPVMTIRGENSQLLSQATVTEMEKRHPGMETLVVAGQGHAPLPHSAGISAAIAQFLARASL
jgi:pimeloyl-ACP methyl ester carboxylesterase